MTNVHDVAAYITGQFDTGISTMKLQKLCFFAQGWSFALLDEKLFPEDFQAWRNGPVCYDLFDKHRGSYSVSSWPAGNASTLTKRQRIVVDAMLENYGALTGLQLSELTHRKSTPWRAAREGLRDGQASNAVIPQKDIRKHFKSANAF